MQEESRSALDAAIAGDPRPGQRALEHVPEGEALALRTALARIDPALPMPELGAIEAAGPREPVATSLAASLVARDALARLDAESLSAASALACTFAHDDARATLEAEAALAWSLHLRGQPEIVPRARALEGRASRARLPHLVIDAACLAAHASLSGGALEEATSLARRASRMARTEGLPLEEYLAHLILARVRRYGGRPHLATRILTSLARTAPPSLRGWIALELALSGAPDIAARLLQRGASAPGVSSLLGLLAAAGEGDRAAFDRARHALQRAFAARVPFALELAAIADAIDPVTVEPAAAIAPFVRGDVDAVPGVLAGIAQLAHAEETHPLVRVLVGSGARRVFSIGAPLIAGAQEIGREAGTKQHRREKALAILAFAGPAGLPKEELFQRVWGFSFAPHLHQGVLDVLLHRVRGILGDAADLVRADGRVALLPSKPLMVVDPRAERSVDDGVLRALAVRGAASARELADDLGMPLRSVQSALARLVEGEECVRVGDGQRVTYRIEDTTFGEATRF